MAVSSSAPRRPDHERAKIHHLIPEFLLARFADDNGLVVVTDKTSATRKLIHPRVLMTQRDYYTIETLEGPSDAIERWLSQVEGSTADALRRIEAGAFPPRDDDLVVLSIFTALQLLRGPGLQEMFEDLAHQVTRMQAGILASVPDAMRAALFHAEGRTATNDEIAEQQASLQRALNGDRIATSVPRTTTIDAMLNAVPVVANIVAQRSWDMYECEDDIFIMGDTPVALWSPPLPDGRRMPVGFATAREITFAIDPHRCILLGRPGEAGGRYAIPRAAEGPQLINERHYLYARRFTFQHPATRFVFDEERAATPTPPTPPSGREGAT